MSGHHRLFRIRSRCLFGSWAFLLFFLIWATGFTASTFSGRCYPDLDDLPFIYLITGVVCVMWLAYVYRLTIFIELLDGHFLVKKFGQKARSYSYTAILAHNERLEITKGGTYYEFTVYLADNWFLIRSTEFPDYDYVKTALSRYGQPTSYWDVITPADRTRLGWFISGMALLILAAIALGFALHNPADPNPARLVTLTNVAEQVKENRNKGTLNGVTISLRAFPDFAFYVSRRNYDTRLEGLQESIQTKQPVTLLIRRSEFRKKLTQTEPLTFGDKYDEYKEISVFGMMQGNSVRIKTSQPVYEPTHTNPLLRTLLLSILLLLCWTGWVYVDRLPVLRGPKNAGWLTRAPTPRNT